MAAYDEDAKDSKGEVLVVQVPWKSKSRGKKIALAARFAQVLFSGVTFATLAVGLKSYWATTIISSGLWASCITLVIGALGLVVASRPEKIHWHVMLVLDVLGFGTAMAATVCTAGSINYWYGYTLGIAGTITASIAMVGTLVIVVQTACKHIRITLVSSDGSLESTAAKTKSLEDQGWSQNIRPYDLEDLYVRPSHPGPSEARNTAASPDVAAPIASQDIALQPMPQDVATQASPPQAGHVDIRSREIEADNGSTAPALSLSDVSRWSITSGTLTGAPSTRSSAPSYKT